MSIAAEQRARLLLIHGWGFGPAVWNVMRSSLGSQTDVVTPVLPGYGRDAGATEHDPLGQAEALLLPLLTAPTVVVGWSFGGLPAIRLAQARPDQVRALVLIASLPCFRREHDWPAGLVPAGIAAVRQQLQDRPAAALAYVAALSARGDHRAAKVRRTLTDAVPDPLPATVLRQGLDVLLEADLRATDMSALPPLHVILGDGDTVIGMDCAEPLQQWCPSARIQVLAGIGHAPMVSRPDVVAGLLEQWL